MAECVWKSTEWEQKGRSVTQEVGEIRAHCRGLPLKCWSSEVWAPLPLPTQFQYKPMSEELKHRRILTSFSY